ncbi:MAG: methyltransferase domain-containing protein [Lachnospiraceae bacterium]|nr:methyltransferase domain-containing protein [Lachnospiraceae bacterium]
MKENELKERWKKEEETAQIRGWDFSHIYGRYEEEEDLPWDYDRIVRSRLKADMKLLDYDTGGGEYLLSLGHPYCNTSATEGYPPNVKLCREVLTPLGIDLKECADPSAIPFPSGEFDIMINRHGSFDPSEIHRILKPGGLFVTQQVGGDNDRDLVQMVLPDLKPPFPDLRMDVQRRLFEEAGFEILQALEAYRPIRFFDVGAFVWFAHVIEWEFPEFSVDRCFDALLKMQEVLEKEGKIEGTIHRYLIEARKK